jgi:hypothetical protein
MAAEKMPTAVDPLIAFAKIAHRDRAAVGCRSGTTTGEVLVSGVIRAKYRYAYLRLRSRAQRGKRQ